ncbi:hypothetical protein Sdagh_30760 [Streptomyces daghestanicus]|uniref:Uncharacterized protein n=1 Tax=Streptomyces daghestanicus TaxID=66885 RepID=A0ABQ3Q244_9ACTN|nr:hypothetical protein GCM10010240_27820 [Streptomyces griseoviridis]GHI31346.1 hypothetical protein Sdagh_30760 [Streptomyces daghestanicus]
MVAVRNGWVRDPGAGGGSGAIDIRAVVPTHADAYASGGGTFFPRTGRSFVDRGSAGRPGVLPYKG